MMNELSSSLGHCYYYEEELFNFIPRVLLTSITKEQFDHSLVIFFDSLVTLFLGDNR